MLEVKKRGAVQTRGNDALLYGYDDAVGQAEVIIAEGEMDKLALEEAGFTNVVSVRIHNLADPGKVGKEKL